MKNVLLVVFLFSCIYAEPYVFLLKKYDKEVELESKIISQIAHSSLEKKIILFIPQITKMEQEIYSKLFTLGSSCTESNFIFVKRNFENDICQNDKKLFFTNNYKKLLLNEKYYGAFFWSKSRPNIVFIKKRLSKNQIALPSSYNQFIEDL